MAHVSDQNLRYDTSGRWYKGNIHLHTTRSDGGMSYAEVAALYAAAGYDFLAAADHWIASDMAQEEGASGLIWLDGVELDGRDETGALYHVVCLGRLEGISREMGLSAALEAARAQGALTILAHPQWSGNTFDDLWRWPFDGIEVYNHVCRWLNGKGDGVAYWNAMLGRRPDALMFAVDDAHLRPEHPGWNGGWIVVNAAARTAEGIVEAIRRGNYYASCGPEFHTIRLHDGQVEVETSPVRFIRLVGPAYRGQRIGSFDGQRYTAARFALPDDWDYAYLEIEDECGRRAWTNNLKGPGWR
ncbi:MAG: PHP domain-containing protein [Anaerolineae bacterium]